MTTNLNKEGTKLTATVEGRLDTTTAPEFDAAIKPELEGVTDLVIDMKDLAYISSAGLRVLLSTQKIMKKQGTMVIVNASDDIKEVFEITGFTDILVVK